MSRVVEHCDVLIVGGGIMGCAAALGLARRGKSVILLERDQAGTRASAVNFGGVRRHGRNLAEIPLSLRARQIWTDLQSLIGIDGEFTATGHLRIARTAADIDLLRQHLLAVAPLGLELEYLERGDLVRRFPWLGPAALAATYCADDGQANPRLVAPAFAAAARNAGTNLIEQAEVIEGRYESGNFNLRLRDGRLFAAPILVNAAGAWADRIAGWFDEPVVLKPEIPQILVTEPVHHKIGPVLGVVGGDLYLRQIDRGNIVFGGGEGRPNVDFTRSRPLPDVSRRAAAMAIRIVPEIARLNIIRSWTGVDGDTIDGSPVVGASETHPGLYHAFGFCGHGFQLGPAVGAVLTELVADGASETDISGLGIGRLRPAPLSDAGSG